MKVKDLNQILNDDTGHFDNCPVVKEPRLELCKLIRQAEIGDETAGILSMNSLNDSALRLFGEVAMKTVETIYNNKIK